MTDEPDNVTPLDRARRTSQPSDDDEHPLAEDAGAANDEATGQGTVRRVLTVDVRMDAVWESYPHSPGVPDVGDLVTTLIGNRMWIGRVVSLEPLNPDDPSRDDAWRTPLAELPHKAGIEDTDEWHGFGRDPRPGRPLQEES